MTIPGCPRHLTGFSRECYDIRCTKHWEVEGAPSPDEQLERWAKGDATCPNTQHECCPDFGCCNPRLAWPQAKREAFMKAEQGTREKMMMGALSAKVEDWRASPEGGATKVHVTRGEPTDHE